MATNMTTSQQEELIESLLPRRREIFETIRLHPDCSFDFIARNFPLVNPKTLHFDFSQLIKGGLVRKLGTTRGARYRTK